jgi:hypothetical protein
MAIKAHTTKRRRIFSTLTSPLRPGAFTKRTVGPGYAASRRARRAATATPAGVKATYKLNADFMEAYEDAKPSRGRPSSSSVVANSE